MKIKIQYSLKAAGTRRETAAHKTFDGASLPDCLKQVNEWSARFQRLGYDVAWRRVDEDHVTGP